MWFSLVDSRVAFQRHSLHRKFFLIGKFCKSLHGIKQKEASILATKNKLPATHNKNIRNARAREFCVVVNDKCLLIYTLMSLFRLEWNEKEKSAKQIHSSVE